MTPLTAILLRRADEQAAAVKLIEPRDPDVRRCSECGMRLHPCAKGPDCYLCRSRVRRAAQRRGAP